MGVAECVNMLDDVFIYIGQTTHVELFLRETFEAEASAGLVNEP